jgi:hypothetical protein
VARRRSRRPCSGRARLSWVPLGSLAATLTRPSEHSNGLDATRWPAERFRSLLLRAGRSGSGTSGTTAADQRPHRGSAARRPVSRAALVRAGQALAVACRRCARSGPSAGATPYVAEHSSRIAGARVISSSPTRWRDVAKREEQGDRSGPVACRARGAINRLAGQGQASETALPRRSALDPCPRPHVAVRYVSI